MTIARTTILLLTFALLANGQVRRAPNIRRLSRTGPLRGNNLITRANLRIFRRLQRKIITAGSCNVRVCFALDGSASITANNYRSQQDFVQIIAAIIGIDRAVKLSAVQYGLRNIAISSLGSATFLRDIRRSQFGNAPRTFLAAGLGFCIQELRAAINTPARVVIIGDGRSNFGGSANTLVTRFFRRGMSLTAVAVGAGSGRRLGAELIERGERPRVQVLSVGGYPGLARLIPGVVGEICGV